jgi:cell division transport system permease protein
MKKIFAWWRRSFREGSVQLWRHKFLSLTTIGLGALILVLLNFVFATQFFADHSIQSLESRADFSIPLREPYDAFEFDALKNSLKPFDIETEVLQAEEFSEFRVPTRVHVKFLDIQQVNDVLEIFKNPRYVEVVGNWDGKAEREFVTVVGNLLKLRKNVEVTSQVLVLLFLFGGILLVINTFQIAVFSRKDEVFIARLVGANPAFITGPFIIEGILLGLLSALFAIILFVLILKQIPVLPIGQIFLYLWNNVFALELLASAAVGGIGAWWSIRRYLRGKLE